MRFALTIWCLLALASIAWADDAGYRHDNPRWRRSQADAVFHEGGHIKGTEGYRYAGRRRHHHPEPVIVEPRERVYGYVYEDERRLSGPEIEGRRRVQIDVMSNVVRLPTLEGHSAEHHTEKRACVDAIKDWKAIVRFKFGERFAGWRNAVRVEKQCVQSSVGQTATARAVDALGKAVGIDAASALYRCEVRAEPRQMPPCFLTGDTWECPRAETDEEIDAICR